MPYIASTTSRKCIKSLLENFILMHYCWRNSLSNTNFLKGAAGHCSENFFACNKVHIKGDYSEEQDQYEIFCFDLLIESTDHFKNTIHKIFLRSYKN